MTFDHLPSIVANRLRAFHQRKRLFGLLRVCFATTILYGLLVLVAMHLDRFLFLEVAFRWRMFWVVHFGAGLLGGMYCLVYLLRRTSVRQIAYELESKLPEDAEERFVTLDDVLVREDLGGGPVAAELAGELEKATVRLSEGIQPTKLVKDAFLRRLAWAAVAVFLVFTALSSPRSYELPLMVERFYFPGRNLPKPSFVKISVTSDKIRVGKGGEAVIQAETSGELPSALLWLMKQLGISPSRCVISLAEGEEAVFEFDQGERSDMSRLLRDVFLYSKGELETSFRYQIRCGDAQTPIMTAEVIAQPKIVDAKLTVTPPAYTGLSEQIITDVYRPLRLLPGTKIVLTFRTDQPVPVRIIRIEKVPEPIEPDWDDATRTGIYEFELKKKVSLEIRVVNDLGFENVERAKISIGLLEDAPPVVRLDDPVGDVEKVPGELVPIKAEVEDDFGIAEVVLQFVMNPDADSENPLREVPIPLEKNGERSVPVSTFFDLDKTGAVPGDVVCLQLRGRDTADNYTESREVLIRIVSFTRGENERMRLAALRFVRDGLGEVLGSERPSAGAGAAAAFDIGRDRYQKILELAKKTGASLADRPSVLEILDLLEKEHHFTDAPRHKEDARLLYGAVRAACAPLARPEGEELYAWRSANLKTVQEDLLPGLIGFRQIKNITWRLFGMRYEAAHIGGMLDKLAAGKSVGEEGLKSLTRRAELYFQTLQDIGDELISLSRTVAALEEKKIENLVGAANTEAFYMRRGSVKKRKTSTENVSKLIVDVLNEIRPACPDLLETESKARARLQALYGETLLAVSPQPNGLAWLEADGRLMTANPFLPVWPRYLNYALQRRVGEGGAEAGSPEPDHRALVGPGGQDAEAIGRGRALADRSAFAWEAETVTALDGISNAEKLLELTLLRAETDWRATGASDAAKTGFARALAKQSPEAETPESAVLALALEITSGGPAAASPQEEVKALADTAGRLLPLQAVGDGLGLLQARFQEIEGLVTKVSEGLKSSENQTADVSKLLAGLERGSAAFRGLVLRLYLGLSLRPSTDAAQVRDEILLLKLRETMQRYAARVSLIVESIEAQGAASLGARELTSLATDLDRLRFLLGTVQKRLEAIAAEYREDSALNEEERKKYVILKEFGRTRNWVGKTTQLLTPSSGPGGDTGSREVALSFIDEFPEAGLVYLAANVDRGAAALKAILEAGAALQGSPPKVDAFEAKIAAGKSAMTSLRGVVAQSGAGEVPERIGAAVGQVLARIERLSLSGPKPTPVEVQRKLYDLGETVKELARLLRDLKDSASGGDEQVAGFRGGPEGIWLKEYRAHAEKARSRLLRQMRFARRKLILGVLEGLKEKPDQSRFGTAYNWSVFLYRLVRSELAGVGGVRPPSSGKSKEGDPHLKFLKEELEKAKQVKNLRNYADITKEYLDSVGDFLRY